MEELKKLQPRVLKRKAHGIPVGIRYWLFFKRHILEKPEVRQEFEKTELDRREVGALVKKLANPLKHGPSFCRRKRSQRSNLRNTTDMITALFRYHRALLSPSSPICTKESSVSGLGIFLRRGVTKKEGQPLLDDYLYGPIFELTCEEEVLELKKDKTYPSLMEFLPRNKKDEEHEEQEEQEEEEKKVKAVIMCGPLSLVNHKPKANLKFTEPRAMKKEEGKEFEGLQCVYAQPTRTSFRGKAGQELFVSYSRDVVF